MIHVFGGAGLYPEIRVSNSAATLATISQSTRQNWRFDSSINVLIIWQVLVQTCVELLIYENAHHCSDKITFLICVFWTCSPMCIYHGKNNSGGAFRFETSIVTPLIVYNTMWTTRHNSCFKLCNILLLMLIQVLIMLLSFWLNYFCTSM